MSPTSYTFTRAGVLQGARSIVPALAGILVFAMAYGTAAAQKGLTALEVFAMSAFVYAGASQMVGLEIWQSVWTPTTILTIMAVTAVVNARMLLLGVTVQPWLRREPIARSAFNLFFLTDASWIVTMRYHNDGGRDVGFLLGAGAALWLPWLIASMVGYFAGAFVPEPQRFGLDLVMPIFFSAMLVPLWKGAAQALPWLVAAIVSLLVHAFLPGYFFIIAGALAGVAAGMLIE